MSDHFTHTAHSAATVVRAASQTVARAARTAVRRLRVEQVGQDIIEYTGVVALIAVIVFMVWQFQLPSTISNALNSKATSIVNGQGSPAPAQGSGSGNQGNPAHN